MASLYDSASLVMIPSGVKNGKTYSIKPTDGSGDLAFSRSNDTATRVNSSGLIEKVRTNACLYSEETDNAWWGKGRLTITANATTNPIDGAATADKMVADATSSSSHDLASSTITVTSGIIYIVSGYFKKAEYDYVVLGSSAAAEKAWFNLNTGVKGAQGGSVVYYDMVSVGDGWYRCFAAILTTSGSFAAEATIANVDGSRVISGVPSGGIFCFGFQLESGDIMTDYIATTSAAVSVGPVANLPRLDYSGGASCPKLLLEPQRTNSLTYSEDFSNAAYTKSQASITANAAIAPDGTMSADKLVEDTSNNTHVIYRGPGGAGDTLSFFAKAAERNWVGVLSNNGDISFFNIANGTLGTIQAGSTATITPYDNGWYRCTLYNTHGSFGMSIYLATANGTNTYTGDGTSGAFIWGAQLEESATYATSYIPTLSAASTRGADAAYKSSATALIGQTEGTIFAEFANPAKASQGRYFSLSDGTAGNRIDVYAVSPTEIGIYAAKASTPIVNTSFVVPANAPLKYAIAYKAGSWAWYLNGVQIGTNTSTNVPALSEVLLATGATLGQAAEANPAVQALVFKTRLTNAELAALTAL